MHAGSRGNHPNNNNSTIQGQDEDNRNHNEDSTGNTTDNNNHNGDNNGQTTDKNKRSPSSTASSRSSRIAATTLVATRPTEKKSAAAIETKNENKSNSNNYTNSTNTIIADADDDADNDTEDYDEVQFLNRERNINIYHGPSQIHRKIFEEKKRRQRRRVIMQHRQELIITLLDIQGSLLRDVVLTRAIDDYDSDNDNPEMMTRRELLKEGRRKLLGFIRMVLNSITDEAGGEVAIVILFQILQNTTNASIEDDEEGSGAAEMEAEEEEVEEEEDDEEEEEEENTTTATSMFEIICFIFGKDTAMEIVDDMWNTSATNITTALGYAITEYGEGKVQLECVYYLLRKQLKLSHTYRNIMEIMIRGNRSIEIGLIAIFMTATLPNKEDDIISTFQLACYRLGRNIVVEIIDDILQQQRAASSSSLSSRSCINTMRALVYAATINDAYNNDQSHTSVHVDGFFFLLRRQPEVLLRCSSSSSKNSSIITSSSNSPTSPTEAGVAAADRDSSQKLADEECTTSSKIRKRKRTVDY